MGSSKKIALFVLSTFLFVGMRITNTEATRINLGNRVWRCASCDQTDVEECIEAASAGDIVIVPAGTCTWTSYLKITKGITVKGEEGGTTKIINGSSDPDYYMIIWYDPSDYSLNAPFRLTGFEFDANSRHILYLGPNGKTAPFPINDKIRIDHNVFRNSGSRRESAQAIFNKGTLYGIVDHNEFIDFYFPTRNTFVAAGDNWWDHSPQNIFVLGSPYYMYFEDNTFSLISGDYWNNNALTDGAFSARYVFRYNNITNAVASYSLWDIHGQQGNSSESMDACFGAEVYGNQITAINNDTQYMMKQRAGQTMVFLNNATTTGSVWNTAYTSGLCVCPERYADLKVTHGSYWWGNRKNLTGDFARASATGGLDCNGLEDIPTLGRDLFSDHSFPGVSSGPLSSLPGTCLEGQGYWATDQSTSDLTGMVGVNPLNPISGTLYQCTAPDIWEAHYTPYTYPHPLTQDVLLTGTPLDQGIRLDWEVVTAFSFPNSTTWRITYVDPAGPPVVAASDLISPTRTYTLTDLTNSVPHTVTLNGMIPLPTAGQTPFYTATAIVIPTGPHLTLHGTPADAAIHLTWEVVPPPPPTITWRIDYTGQTTVTYPSIDIVTPTFRAWTLTGLTNYAWYTVTLNAMLGNTSSVTDTVRVMPTDIAIYLPLVWKMR